MQFKLGNVLKIQEYCNKYTTSYITI